VRRLLEQPSRVRREAKEMSDHPDPSGLPVLEALKCLQRAFDTWESQSSRKADLIGFFCNEVNAALAAAPLLAQVAPAAQHQTALAGEGLLRIGQDDDGSVWIYIDGDATHQGAAIKVPDEDAATARLHMRRLAASPVAPAEPQPLAAQALERLHQEAWSSCKQSKVSSIDKDFQTVQAALAALRVAPAEPQPLNLSDRAVQRRLAAQWGFAEPQPKESK
jgi:hypothetical protein